MAMSFSSRLLPVILSLYVLLDACDGQIPEVCSDRGSLASKVCCPAPTLPPAISSNPGQCGSNLNRGSCVAVSTKCNTRYSTGSEPRLNWPSYFFNRTCVCNGNYAGYDCGECKFGYEGDTCSTRKQLRVRKSVNAADMQWSEYFAKLDRVKHANDSRYVIVLFNEDMGGVADDPQYEVKHISIFNLFAWMHQYIAKTNDGSYMASSSANDYAHESSGFLTWHRLFLLWLEREVQIVLEEPDFTLRYWDWTEPDNRNSNFVNGRLGGNDGNGGVTGNFGEWRTVCWFPSNSSFKNQTCNTANQEGIRSLIRCPLPGSTGCTNPDYWPTSDSVRSALEYSQYRDTSDTYPFNKFASNAFSNHLEGFNATYTDVCSDDENNADCTETETGNITLKRELHNLVHITLGIGFLKNGANISDRAGTMADVAASANDPAFLNHHTMIDCLFEQWLQSQPDSSRFIGPSDDRKFAGHGGNDCIVPFLPLYTHNDMFKKASDFGYSCDLRSFSVTPPTAGSDAMKGGGILMVVICLAAAMLLLMY